MWYILEKEIKYPPSSACKTLLMFHKISQFTWTNYSCTKLSYINAQSPISYPTMVFEKFLCFFVSLSSLDILSSIFNTQYFHYSISVWFPSFHISPIHIEFAGNKCQQNRIYNICCSFFHFVMIFFSDLEMAFKCTISY